MAPAPRPPKRPHVTEIHGARLEDPYRWLHDKDAEEVQAHLRAENAHTEAQLAPLKPLEDRIYEELLGRVQEDDAGVPAKDGPYWYGWRTEKGRPHVVYTRQTSPTAAPTPVLDVNALAEGHAFTSLGAFAVCPDHRRVAYSVDHEGDERHVLRIRDLDAGQDLEDVIENTSDDVAWATPEVLFYVTLDEAARPHRVWRHRLGTDPATDALVFEEPDEAFYVSVGRTRSDGFIIVSSDSAVTSEAHLVPCDDPEAALRCLRPRVAEVEYDVDHLGDRLFVRTNQGAFDFRLESVPVEDPNAAPTEILPHRPGITLEGFEVFARHIVAYEREDGLPQVRVIRLADGAQHRVEIDSPAYDLWPGANYGSDTDELRLVFTSLTVPPTTFTYHLDHRTKDVLRVLPVPGYRAEDYQSARIWAEAPDGTRVPVSVVHRAQTPLDGTAPMLVNAYGAYGMPMEMCFDRDHLPLLDRGFVVATVHARGGGDLGRAWKEAGKLEHKPNTFADVIAATEHLVAEGFGDPARVCLTGRSAGGLMLGAVLNARPELYRAAVAGVPFVDVVNTLLDPELPLTVLEWEEWGNPLEDAEAFARIRAYSPYDNVADRPYPDVLVVAGVNDPRVMYWEPAKWALKLREHGTRPGSRVLVKMDLDVGHGGASGRYGAIRDQAFEWAFVVGACGRGDGDGPSAG